jgi:hypothetical protein
MRYALTTLVVRFRSTLAFFTERDRAMQEFYPDEFPHWMRGGNYFNLIDKANRRVIRFDANRCIVRVEGQESVEPFTKCVEIALGMFARFEVSDIFAMRLEVLQVQPRRRLDQVRGEFASKFMVEAATQVFPKDRNTDYGISLERKEHLDLNFAVVGSRGGRRALVNRHIVFFGPADATEIQEKWLEFKEHAKNESYQTKPRIPTAAHILWSQIIIEPCKAAASLKHMTFKTLKQFSPWAIDQIHRTWDVTLGN